MKEETNYTLALETQPNSYTPIHIFPKIKNIDDITGSYTEEEFRKMLVKNYYIDEEYINCPLVILYNDNGIRKVKEGLTFYGYKSANMNEWVKKFMSLYRCNGNVINDIYQHVFDRKDIDEESKEILHRINNARKTDNYDYMLDYIYNINYYDIRAIYLYINTDLYKKIDENDNYKLTRRIEK